MSCAVPHNNNYYMKNVTSLLVLFSGLLLLSCNRKDQGVNLGNLKFSTIAVIAGNNVSNYRCVYDSQGNLDSLVYSNIDSGNNNNGYLAFEYATNYYLVHHSTGGTDSIQLNKGNFTYVYQQSTGDSIYFEYNTAGNITKQFIHMPVNGAIDSNVFNWGSFDINYIQSYTSSNPAYYTVNPNIVGQIGDALRINQFLTYGKTYLNTPHLPIFETYVGNVVENYLYKYDASGRISELSVAENFNSGTNMDTIYYKYTYAN